MKKIKIKGKDFQFIFLRLPAAKAERAQQICTKESTHRLPYRRKRFHFTAHSQQMLVFCCCFTALSTHKSK